MDAPTWGDFPVPKYQFFQNRPLCSGINHRQPFYGSDGISFLYQGGTDICGCFAGQNWTVPVIKGEIQSSNLGCAVQCWNEEGRAAIVGSDKLSNHLFYQNIN